MSPHWRKNAPDIPKYFPFGKNALPISKIPVRIRPWEARRQLPVEACSPASETWLSSPLCWFLSANYRPDFRKKNRDRKSTRLNSSHANISYAVFCLKKKKRSGRPLRRPPLVRRSEIGRANV